MINITIRYYLPLFNYRLYLPRVKRSSFCARYAMQKILVGDSSLESARQLFANVPDVEVACADTPEEVIRLALTGEFDEVFTELDYTENGQEGFTILEAIQNVSCRQTLWTAMAHKSEVRAMANKLMANVLDKRLISRFGPSGKGEKV